MSNETARNEPDGAEFLKELDLALEGQNPEGAHAETARFAAQLAGVLQSQRAAAPAELKAKLSPVKPGGKKASTVVSIDRALTRRSRMGLLDWAALVAIVILGGLIWRGLRSESAAPSDSKKLAAEDGKPPVKKEATPAPALPPPGPVPAADAVTEAIVADTPENVAAAKKLERLVSFEFVDTPLGEALGFIGGLTTVPMVLDPKAADFSKHMVTLRVEDMPISVALKWITRLADLSYELRSGAVFVTKWPSQDDVELRVLDVADSPIPAKTLAAMLRQLPFEESAHGGSVDALGNLLRITKSRRDYNQIVSIIARLIENRDKPAFVLDEEATPWKDALRKKLQRKVTLDFADTPLDEGIAFLRSLTGVTMIMDPKLVNGNQPTITLRVTDMDVELTLQWILRLTEAEYQFLDEAIYIAPKGEIEAQPVFTGYNVGALLKQHKLSAGEVTRMLLETVDPESWDRMRAGTASGEDWIFVMHTPEVHAKIKQALLKLSQPAKPRLKAVPPGDGAQPDKEVKNPADPAAKARQDF